MRILGYDYKVVCDNEVPTMDAFGRMRGAKQTIYIASDICEQQKESTLLHEIVEALNWHMQLNLTHPTIMQLETALYQVLRDNGVDLSPLTRHIEGAKP